MVEPNIMPMFATPLAEYSNPKLAQDLKEYILKLNADGIESGVAKEVKHNLIESKFNFFASEQDVIQNALEWFGECFKSTLNDLYGIDSKWRIYYNESWYHITKTNGTHEHHRHPNCSWCGVFYVDPGDSESGWTSFINPIHSTFIDDGNSFLNNTSFNVRPKKGNLILFPSYMAHYQKLYKGVEDRMVIAFNCMIHKEPSDA